MKQRHKRRAVELCKDALILLLTCSALWLAGRTQLMGPLSGLLSEEKRRQARELREPSGHVVLDHKGQPYSPNALSLAFTRFVRSSGLPRVTLHGLRHSFATIASFQGVSLFDIGKALGHSTPATTGRIYTHLIDRTHEETLMRVSDALK